MPNDNVARLRAIVSALDIPLASVARLSGMSRPFVSRLIHGEDRLASNVLFWKTLEANLGRLVEQRQVAVFDIPAAPAGELGALAESLKRRKDL